MQNLKIFLNKFFVMQKEGNKRYSHTSLCFGNILGAPGLQGGGGELNLLSKAAPTHNFYTLRPNQR